MENELKVKFVQRILQCISLSSKSLALHIYYDYSSVINFTPENNFFLNGLISIKKNYKFSSKNNG